MFCQASMKVKLSPLSVLCYITFMLVVNKDALPAFQSVCHVLFRDKTRRLVNKMLYKAITGHKHRNDD